MKLCFSLQDAPVGPKVAALGFFDGVHRGHLSVLYIARRIAAEMGVPAVALSFDRHPLEVLNRPEAPPLLTTNVEKVRQMAFQLMDALVLQPFTPDVAALSAEDYLLFLREQGVCHLVMGQDHRFGKDGRGNIRFLQEHADTLGFGLTLIKPLLHDGQPISSSRVRQALAAGQLGEAKRMLGRPYSLEGIVVHGKGLGHTWGFPTLNLKLDDNKLLPRYGVYFAEAYLSTQGKIDRMCLAVLNIGQRPTVDDNAAPNVEAFLLDTPGGDFYDEFVSFTLFHFHRPEMHFPSVEQLQAQIQRDVDASRRYFQAHHIDSLP